MGQCKDKGISASAVVQCIKQLLAMLLAHIQVLFQVLITPLWTQLPGNAPVKAKEDGPNTSTPVHMGNLDGFGLI